MRHFLAALVVCCLAGPLLGVPAARPVLKLLYPSNRTGNFEIFSMNPDGSGAKNLTNHKAEDCYPALSPDGSKIAFTSDRDGVRNIYVMDRTGANVKNLTNSTSYDADPAWSPDGKKILFVSTRMGRGFRLFVMDADGKNVQMLSNTDNGFGLMYPAWSPDGKKIAYGDRGNTNALEVFVCDANGKNRKQLTKLGGQNSLAAFSPDGKKIAFQHVPQGQGAGSLYIMNADGSNPKEILRGEGSIDASRPVWDLR